MCATIVFAYTYPTSGSDPERKVAAEKAIITATTTSSQYFTNFSVPHSIR